VSLIFAFSFLISMKLFVVGGARTGANQRP